MKELTLIEELNAEDNSFLIELRINLNWNPVSFINLLNKLYIECQDRENDTMLSREIAGGVWYISTFIKDWSQHEDFPKKFSKEYYELAYELINDLTYHYFVGGSLYQSKSRVDNKIEEMKNKFTN